MHSDCLAQKGLSSGEGCVPVSAGHPAGTWEASLVLAVDTYLLSVVYFSSVSCMEKSGYFGRGLGHELVSFIYLKFCLFGEIYSHGPKACL